MNNAERMLKGWVEGALEKRAAAALSVGDKNTPSGSSSQGAAGAPPSPMHPNDAPGSHLKYIKPKRWWGIPIGRQIIPREILEDVYKDRLDAERGKAMRYATDQGLLWGGNPSDPNAPYLNDNYGWPRSLEDPVTVVNGEPSYNLISNRIAMPRSRDDAESMEARWRDRWTEDRGDYSGTSKADLNPYKLSVLLHEMDHSLYWTHGYDTTIPWTAMDYGMPRPDNITYPEKDVAEITPPAAAIQRHLWTTRGSRLESPEEYREWVRQMDGDADARRALPGEVRRWFNYRDAAKRDPWKLRGRLRLMWLDGVMGKILPGIVKNTTERRGDSLTA